MNLNEAIAEEGSLPPGNYRAQFDMTEPVSISGIKDKLSENDVEVINIKQWQSNGLWHLGVSFEKPDPASGISFLPGAVIPLIGFAIVSVLVTVSIFRIETITNSLSKLALIIGGVAIAFAFVKGRAKAR